MKATPILFAFVFLASLGVSQEGVPNTKGLIYGHAVYPDGRPASRIQLQARPSGVMLVTALPLATTDENGNYQMIVPWWGRYTVYAEDPDSGYSSYVTGTSGNFKEAVVSVDHPEAEFNFRLPPKGGFLHFHLTNGKTGDSISGVEITVFKRDEPSRPVYSRAACADKTFLVPSDKNVLIHVTSSGFKEWDQSAHGGKAIRLTPGAELTIDVVLDPLADER